MEIYSNSNGFSKSLVYYHTGIEIFFLFIFNYTNNNNNKKFELTKIN